MKLLYSIFAGALLLIMFNAINNTSQSKSNGSPGRYSGSVGDARNCQNCHQTSTSATGLITTNIPAAGYKKDTIYTITVTPGAGTSGFELTCENSANAKTGTWTIISGSGTKLCNSNGAVTHTTPKSSGAWTANWTAPATSTGTVKFYTAVHSGTSAFTHTSNISVQPDPSSTTSLADITTETITTKVFPNPTSGSFDVEYNMLTSGTLSITVFDLTGKAVAPLFMGYREAGAVKEHFNLDNQLSSGLYLLMIASKDSHAVRKLMVQ